MARNREALATPVLRFPAFHGAPAWHTARLGDMVDFRSGGTPSKENPAYWNGTIPWVSAKDMKQLYLDDAIDHVTVDAVADGAKVVPAGTVLMLTRGMTLLNDVPICVVRRDMSFNQDVKAIVPKGALDDRFLPYLLLASKERLLQLVDIAGHGTGRLDTEELKTMMVMVPCLEEQRRVTDCLTSLSDAIIAQAQKVKALKAHKQGLMQQLFPREGETVPRLRFPEFRNAPEWAIRELGPLTSKVGSGVTPLGGEKAYKSAGRPFVRSQNVGWGELLLDDVAYIDESTHRTFDATEIKERDVLLNITGASIGRSAVADSRIANGNVNQHVCIIRTSPTTLNPELLSQYLISELGQKQIDSFQAGGNRQGLNFGQIRGFQIPLPQTVREQQRIADCLSSLDHQIVAESEWLDALRSHKAGLMQQLFPAPTEAE